MGGAELSRRNWSGKPGFWRPRQKHAHIFLNLLTVPFLVGILNFYAGKSEKSYLLDSPRVAAPRRACAGKSEELKRKARFAARGAANVPEFRIE
jgi:hypothetical protein